MARTAAASTARCSISILGTARRRSPTLAAVSSATAADLPVRKAPPVVPAFSWTGCYLGGYVGGAWQGGDGATFTDQGQNGIGPAGSIACLRFCLIRAAL